MSTIVQPSRLLRFALIGDAVASGATGLALVAGAGALAGSFGLPESLLRYAGLFFLPYAAIVAYVGTRATVARGVVWAVIAANALWAVESALLLASGWVSPTALGTAFVVAQAAAVAVLAELQFIGLRRTQTRIAMPA